MFGWIYRLLAPRLREIFAARKPLPKRKAGKRPTTAPEEEASPPMLCEGPWDGGLVIPSGDPDEIRDVLLDQLRQERANAETAEDHIFVTRMLQTLETDALDLPPFPDVAFQLRMIMSDDSRSLVHVARVVERDHGLVKNVWASASGAAYARPPCSLHHAVARLGLDALWQMSASLSLRDDVFSARGFEEVADAIRIRSQAAAEVAARMSGEPRGNFYLAALLHEVGHLVVVREAARGWPDHLPSHQLIERLGIDLNPLVGALVAQSWGLGARVSLAVGYHQEPDSAPDGIQPLARMVRMARISIYAAEAWSAGDKLPHSETALMIASGGARVDATRWLREGALALRRVGGIRGKGNEESAAK